MSRDLIRDLVFKSGAGAHPSKTDVGLYGRSRSNVWRSAGVGADRRNSGDRGKLLALHPKPVALLADAILDGSAPGDIVLDPFLGSGSTLIAAEHVGRTCHGVEIDPVSVDAAIRRWQRHSGESAIHALTLEPFDALVARQEARHGR